ncbi:MAG: AAA family ATPase [Kofleriaceae bacterium]
MPVSLVHDAPRVSAPAVFVGRTAELERVDLASRHVRLVAIYGVGGIGKTAFMMKAAHAIAARANARIVHHDCRAGESPATLLRALVHGLAIGSDARNRRPADDHDVFGALLQHAEATPLVLCLDNAHRPTDPGVCEAIASLASRGVPLWVIVASRESLPFATTEIDHVVVRLSGLSPDETRALWEQLEQLYGPASSVLDPQSSGGNPLLLKHHFTQRKIALRDQLGLDTLTDEERELLRELATFRKPATAGYLLERRDALDALLRRFLVDERADGRFELHDVVREAVHASAWAPTQDHHARCFAFYRDRSAIDADELERLHHASAAGMDESAEQILLARYAGPLTQITPPNAVAQHQIAQAIDQLMTWREVHPSIAILRVLIRGRMGDAITAYRQIQALRGPHQPMAELVHAELALLLGHVHEAAGALSNSVEDPRLTAPIRALAYAMLTDVTRQGGDLVRSRQLLDAESSPLSEIGPLGAVVSAALRATYAHDLELHAEAAQALADLNKLLTGLGLGAVPIAIARALERAVRLGAGHRISEQDDPGELLDEVPFLRNSSRMLRIDQLAYRGNYQSAADLADTVRQMSHAHRSPLMTWWALWRWGDSMRVLGHAKRVVDEVSSAIDRARDLDHASAWPRLAYVASEALLDLGQLDEAARFAADAGNGLPGCKMRLAAVRARAKVLAGGDPLAARAAFERGAPRGTGHAGAVRDLAHAELDLWCGDLDAALARANEIETTASRAGWNFVACRARLVIAEVACRRGDIVAALPPLEAAQADAGARGWIAELVMADLLAAAVHRLDGETRAMERCLESAAARASRHDLAVLEQAALAALAKLRGGDGTLLGERLARRLSLIDPITCRMLAHDGARYLTSNQAAALDLSAATLIDLVRGRVVLAGVVIDLSRNASQLKLLATLAATPNQPVTNEAIAAATWNVDYDPKEHRGRVLMTISRLRKLLGASTIELGDGSYRLVLPSPWVVLESFISSAAAATSAA